MDKEELETLVASMVVPITFDSPMTVHLNQSTGALVLETLGMVAGSQTGAKFQAHLTPSAVRELLVAVKSIESYLGMPIEDLAKPNSVQ